MAKAKSSKNKDDMKKKKSFKNKSETSPKKGAESLKSLDADQQQSPVPADKSLTSLKKIQKQLDAIVAQREAKNKQIKALKKKTKALGEQTTALSQETTALSQQTKALSKQAKKSESQRSKYALNNDLLRIKTALEKKTIQFDKETSKLSKEIIQFKDLTHRVEHKIQTLEIQTSAKDAAPSASELQGLNKNNKLLFKKVSNFEEKLNQFSDTFMLPEEATAEFAEQLNLLNQTILQLSENYQAHDTQIKLLQTDTGNIRKSLQRDIDNQQQVIDSHRHGMENLEQAVTRLKQNMGDYQQELKSHQQKFNSRQQDFESHQLELKSHQQEFNSHQQDLKTKMDQFNEQLKQSQHELKQQIQLLPEAEHNADLEQFNETLDKLTQQLSDVSEQYSHLQSLFSAMQEQQNTDSEHHDELSKQYLTQQQQLEKHEAQIVQLIPVISQSSTNEQQLKQISASLEQSAHMPDDHSQLENDLQSALLTLDQKIDKSQQQYQKSIDKLASQQRDAESHQLDMENQQLKMVSYQQDQSVSVSQLNKKLKIRSQLFSLGLISVLTISILLLFNQDIFNQIAEKDAADRQELIARIKMDVTNDTFTQINALSKQNSSIISQQFNQVRDSIKAVRKQTELISKTNSKMAIQVLQNNWQKQHQLLQEGLSSTQMEQQGLNKTVEQLAEKISTVGNQFQQLQKSQSQNSDISPPNKLPDIEIIGIEKIKSPFYTIQLLGALHQESIRSFIRQHRLTDSSRIYQTELQDKPWYILVQGHYSSFSQAKEKLEQLPEYLRKNSPWIKKLP